MNRPFALFYVLLNTGVAIINFVAGTPLNITIGCICTVMAIFIVIHTAISK